MGNEAGWQKGPNGLDLINTHCPNPRTSNANPSLQVCYPEALCWKITDIWQFHPLTDVDTSCNLLPLLKAAMCVWGKEASDRQIGEPRSSQCSHDPLKALMGCNKTSRMRWQRTCHYYSGFFWDVEKGKFHSVIEKGQWGRAGLFEWERRAIANLKASLDGNIKHFWCL